MDGCINTFGFSRTLKYPLKYIEETITEWKKIGERRLEINLDYVPLYYFIYPSTLQDIQVDTFHLIMKH